jgi:hypothetical protein
MALVASLGLGACGSDGSYQSGFTCEQARELGQDFVDNITFERKHLKLGEPISMTLSVTNCTDGPVAVRDRDSQRYDFIVAPDDGHQVWRWSADKAFTQAVGEERLASGETRTYTEVWDQESNSGEQVPPGRYTLVGDDLRCEFDASESCTSGIGVVIEIQR